MNTRYTVERKPTDDWQYNERLAHVLRNTQAREPSWVTDMLGPRSGWRHPAGERRTY